MRYTCREVVVDDARHASSPCYLAVMADENKPADDPAHIAPNDPELPHNPGARVPGAPDPTAPREAPPIRTDEQVQRDEEQRRRDTGTQVRRGG